MAVRRPSLVEMTDTNHIPTVKRWDTNPDRESLRIIYRFLSRRETIESVTLEPRRTHLRLVRAIVSNKTPSISPGILKVRWYETGDFVITYQTDRENDTCPLLRWTHLSESGEIKVSHNKSDDIQTLTVPSHHPAKNRFHPLQVLPFLFATIEEHAK